MTPTLGVCLLLALISTVCIQSVGAQVDLCPQVLGSRTFMRHVNVSLSAGDDAEKYPGIFYYDLPNKQIRITYTPTDITTDEVTEWQFFTQGVTVRTCRGECSRFITDPAKNLFPVLMHTPNPTDPIVVNNGVLVNSSTCFTNADGNIQTFFKQVDNTLNPPEVELEIQLTLSPLSGLIGAVIDYPKADKDGTLYLEFLNATDLRSPADGGNFPRGTWTPPADCDASSNITVCKRLVDLAFILDGSSSISIEEFKTLIAFVEEFISPDLNIITIDQDVSRAAIVVFEGDAVIHEPLTFERSEIQAEINNLLALNANRTGGKTNIAAALDAGTAIFSNRRNNVHRVAVLVTDGVHTATGGSTPEQSATVLKSNGVTVIVVAVGDSVDFAQLQSVASEKAFFGIEEFDGIGKLINELVPTVCDGEYEQPCDGCAGICFCSNRCVEPMPPTAPTTEAPIVVPTQAPCLEPEPICCPDASGKLHRFDCPTIHADIDFEEVDDQNRSCVVLACPDPEDIPGMLEVDESVKSDAQCKVSNGNGTCLIVVSPSGGSGPTTGLAVAVGSSVLVLSAIAFVAYRVISGAAAGGAGGAAAGSGLGAAANTSPVFAPAANVNTSPLGA